MVGWCKEESFSECHSTNASVNQSRGTDAIFCQNIERAKNEKVYLVQCDQIERIIGLWATFIAFGNN